MLVFGFDTEILLELLDEFLLFFLAERIVPFPIVIAVFSAVTVNIKTYGEVSPVVKCHVQRTMLGISVNNRNGHRQSTVVFLEGFLNALLEDFLNERKLVEFGRHKALISREKVLSQVFFQDSHRYVVFFSQS